MWKNEGWVWMSEDKCGWVKNEGEIGVWVLVQ